MICAAGFNMKTHCIKLFLSIHDTEALPLWLSELIECVTHLMKILKARVGKPGKF